MSRLIVLLKKTFTKPYRIPGYLGRKLYAAYYQIKYLFLLLLSENDFIFKDVQGSIMKLSLKDKGIQRDLAVQGIREVQTTKIFQQELSKMKRLESNITICDIGANVGYWSLMAVNILGEQAQVLAIEPVEENIERLLKNIQLNQYENQIAVIQCAVGEKEGITEMFLTEHSNLHTLQPRGKKKKIMKDTILVPVKPLSFILENQALPSNEVDVIRMDVQGYEAKILKGMEKLINQNKELLINIETHINYMSDYEVSYIVNLFSNNNFKIISSIDPLVGRDLKFNSIKDIWKESAELILKKESSVF